MNGIENVDNSGFNLLYVSVYMSERVQERGLCVNPRASLQAL
jgi:hypothetical protein